MHINKRWGDKKAVRQAAAAERIGSATYSIHDRQRVAELLLFQHRVKQAVAKKLGKPAPSEGDLELALRRNARRYLHFVGFASKYRPHQGAKECARRVRG